MSNRLPEVTRQPHRTVLTTGHQGIAEVFERFRRRHEGMAAELAQQFSGLAAIYGGKAIPRSTQAGIDGVFRGLNTGGSRELPPGGVAHSGKMVEDNRKATAKWAVSAADSEKEG